MARITPRGAHPGYPAYILGILIRIRISRMIRKDGQDNAAGGAHPGYPAYILGIMIHSRGMMARYEHLPLYAKAMELAVYLQGTVRNFSRYDKYTTGSDLRNLSREIIRLIIEANSQTDKSVKVAELVVACDLMKTTIVFAKDTKAFQAFSQFQHAAALADVLCRQSQGWLQSIEKKSQNRQPPEADRRAS